MCYKNKKTCLTTKNCFIFFVIKNKKYNGFQITYFNCFKNNYINIKND